MLAHKIAWKKVDSGDLSEGVPVYVMICTVDIVIAQRKNLVGKSVYTMERTATAKLSFGGDGKTN